MSLETSDFDQRRGAIIHQLRACCPIEPTIVAVTKRQPDSLVESALLSGHRVFGENRLQEAQQRWTNRRKLFDDLELHFIGPLQTNKVEAVVSLFDVIQTLDRPKLARALANAIQKTGRKPILFIQVNTGEETQKSGVAPKEFPEFYRYCSEELKLAIDGLMCIPPAHDPPAPHFALIEKLSTRFDLKYKSMGMSNDYEIAAQLGATHVRIGTGLFGSRQAHL